MSLSTAETIRSNFEGAPIPPSSALVSPLRSGNSSVFMALSNKKAMLSSSGSSSSSSSALTPAASMAANVGYLAIPSSSIALVNETYRPWYSFTRASINVSTSSPILLSPTTTPSETHALEMLLISARTARKSLAAAASDAFTATISSLVFANAGSNKGGKSPRRDRPLVCSSSSVFDDAAAAASGGTACLRPSSREADARWRGGASSFFDFFGARLGMYVWTSRLNQIELVVNFSDCVMTEGWCKSNELLYVIRKKKKIRK